MLKTKIFTKIEKYNLIDEDIVKNIFSKLILYKNIDEYKLVFENIRTTDNVKIKLYKLLDICINYMRKHLCIDDWKKTKAINENRKLTQRQFYLQNNCDSDIYEKLVNLDSKAFGSVMEKLIMEIFGLSKRTSTQNDATLNGKKIEIKGARYWGGVKDCKWEHIELEYDYDILIFALVGFTNIETWAIKRKNIIKLCDKKILTKQGQQGWWTKKSKILDFLTPIKNRSDLEKVL